MSAAVVQFLGSGDAFGSGGRYQTCIYVQVGSVCFLIDCGASSLIAMKRFGVNPTSISHILLTHLHGDHFGGIPFLVRETQIAAKRTAPLTVAGPRGTISRIHDALEVFFPGSVRGQSFELQLLELENDSPNAVGPLTVTPYRALHTPGTNPQILRVEFGDKVIAYSGDTEWTEDLIKAADGADLFICETYFFEREIKNHLNYRTLMRHRARLNCRRLVVTHMSDDMLSHLSELEVEYAEDGKRIRL